MQTLLLPTCISMPVGRLKAGEYADIKSRKGGLLEALQQLEGQKLQYETEKQQFHQEKQQFYREKQEQDTASLKLGIEHAALSKQVAQQEADLKESRANERSAHATWMEAQKFTGKIMSERAGEMTKVTQMHFVSRVTWKQQPWLMPAAWMHTNA